ncbi:S8 family serine peptidase [Bacillus paralicheniformis]
MTIKGGISFKETDNYVDLNGHGTHIAGIINSIAPKADIYAVKVLDKKLSGSYDDLIKGIQWAIANNVDIISMSLGGDKKSESLHKAIKEAHQKGSL